MKLINQQWGKLSLQNLIGMNRSMILSILYCQEPKKQLDTINHQSLDEYVLRNSCSSQKMQLTSYLTMKTLT